MTVASRFLGRAFGLPPASARSVGVERDLKVPMSDGAVLLADRYVPPGEKPPLVLVRSPYGRRGPFGLLFGRLLAERGFQVLVQSCRGTFGSTGSFDPFAERDDGLATVAWMRRQAWYPGSFGTTGASYLGIVQWAIAADAGPEHKAMVALVTTSDTHATVYEGGSFSLQTMLGWTDQVAHQERLFALIRQPAAARRLAPLFDRLPLGALDRKATGRQVRYWQDWLAHPEPEDPYWAPRRFGGALSAPIAPASFVGGWYDIFLPAQLRDYAALRDAGHEPRLLIGPWQHTTPAGIAASLRESVAFLRARLLDDLGLLGPTPVRIYVTGAEEWRDLPSWPPQASEQRWHLQSAGALRQDRPAAAEPDNYIYDPAKPTPSLAGPALAGGKSRTDNRSLEARPDVLTYTGQPLESDLEVIGQVTADLFVRSSREHTDFFVRLCEVDPSGRSVNVCDALRRLSPGQPGAEADGTIRVRIELWPAAHRFRKGNRLRVQISSGAHPRYARNLGTAQSLVSAASSVTARQHVFHDPEHPSAIILPAVG